MKMTYGSTQIWAVIKKHVKLCPGPITVMLVSLPIPVWLQLLMR